MRKVEDIQEPVSNVHLRCIKKRRSYRFVGVPQFRTKPPGSTYDRPEFKLVVGQVSARCHAHVRIMSSRADAAGAQLALRGPSADPVAVAVRVTVTASGSFRLSLIV